jgi:hypothetical protein
VFLIYDRFQRKVLWSERTGIKSLYSYAQVENALAEAFGIGPDKRGALRGRIKHFQRLGISPSSPGKGRTIDYEKKDALRWAIAMEFAEFGIDPTVIKPALYIVGNALAEHANDKNVWLVFSPRLMSHPAQDGGFHAIVVTDLARYAAALEQGSIRGHHDPRRLGIIDISRLKRELDQCLDHGSAD